MRRRSRAYVHLRRRKLDSMRLRSLLVVVTFVVLTAAGCGWKPPSAPPPKPDTCTTSDAPSTETVHQALAGLPPAPADSTWTETSRGHAVNCPLNWVLVSMTVPSSGRPEQVLFFDRNTSLGPATPEPRSYITVTDS